VCVLSQIYFVGSDVGTVDYVDSLDNQVSTFDYDVSTGKMSNRQEFATPPPGMDEDSPTQGVFDGLCMDGAGNVWVARWKDSRIVGYNPKGEIICFIRTKGSRSPTIPCFGGE
jgi:sugar lactone lactonase YvrE